MDKEIFIRCFDMKQHYINNEKISDVESEIKNFLDESLFEEYQYIVIKSITPMYNEDNELEQLMVFYEVEEDKIGVKIGSNEEIEFYTKEYLNVFQKGNTIRYTDEILVIKDIKYNLDEEYLLLEIDVD